MTTGLQTPVEERFGSTRQQIDLLVKEIARLAEQEVAPADFFGPFLQGTLEALAAPAGAVWLRTGPDGLELQIQIDLARVVALEDNTRRRQHDELLRQVLRHGRPIHAPPHARAFPAPEGAAAAVNPTDYLILIVPIRIDDQSIGLVEVFQRLDCAPEAVPGFLQFLNAMAGLASIYARNRQRRQMAGQEQVWTRLEAFALQVQGSLNPTEVSYLVANEGRRLIECDRLSVLLRRGRSISVEAISGVETIERRSRQVRRMRALGRQVLEWGHEVVFRGVPDSTLPPGVVRALDAYLEVSPSRFLAVRPLRDPREEDGSRPARSLLVIESFDPAHQPEQLLGRLDVVGKHATRSLFNAAEYQRIPFRWLWQPLARVQEGVGGKARALAVLVCLAVLGLVAALVFVPYPLKMDARGQLLPEERRWIYAPVEGHVLQFAEGVRPGGQVTKNQSLVLMYDLQLELKMDQLASEIENALEEAVALAGQLNAAATEAERRRISAEKKQKEFVRDSKREELRALRERTHAVESRPGQFWLKSPLQGTVLNWDFRENLTNRYVKPSDPLLRIGDKYQAWEVELKIPQKHIGQILRAFPGDDPREELDVDLLLMSAPTHVYKGKLARDKVAAEAGSPRDEASEAEPVVLASVRLEGADIAPAERVPRGLLVAGTEVHGRVRCGKRALGYALFYGVGEFFYDKVVFFF